MPEEGMKRRFGPSTAVADDRTPMQRARERLAHAASNGGFAVFDHDECKALAECIGSAPAEGTQ